jgi:hypothetical protein
MVEQSAASRDVRSWLSHGVSAVLAAAAVVAMATGSLRGISPADTDPMESPLALAVARQLLAGPWEIYGPYGAKNVLVLIHAPFYYHLAALWAWPLHAGGLSVATASLVAGRLLSLVGLAITLATAYRFARLGGAPARAGWWATALVASSPIVGAMAFTVRPDMLGVALQTTGVFLVCRALTDPARPGIAGAFAVFALALCLKQHYVVSPLVCALVLVAAWRRGRIGLKELERAALTGIVIVVVAYAAEELATGGRMSQAVFRAAAQAARVHPGDFVRAVIVGFAVAGQSSGIVAVLIAAGLAGLDPARRPGTRVVLIAGIALLACIAVRSCRDFSEHSLKTWELHFTSFTVAASIAVVLPACFVLARRLLLPDPIDRVLLIALTAEGVVLLALGYASTGAWVNYGMQAAVFLAILTARSLSRACAGTLSLRGALAIAVAVCIVLIAACATAVTIERRQRVEGGIIRYILDYYQRPSTEFFFVGRPGQNRLNGRLDLVYDDWLYPVFESLRLAEPRSVWLVRALGPSGSIRYVVNTSESPEIEGLGVSLPQLGYSRRHQLLPFYTWERRSARLPR